MNNHIHNLARHSDAIIEDIRRSDCLVFIVITKDGINETKHKHFYQELIECKKIIENNAKRKDLFVPILLCEPDTICLLYTSDAADEL